MLNAERTLLDRDKPVEDALRIAVVSIGSFDMQYSDYHIMRDLIVELLEHGHTVDLVQKKLLDKTQYPVQFEKYLGTRLFVHNIPFEKKDKSNLRARYLADLSYYRKACRFLKTSRPDKIFLQSNNTAFYTVFYAKHILKRPILYSEQDIFPENAYFAGILSSHSVVYKVAHSLQKYAYKNVSMLTTISDDMKSTMIDLYGISSDKIHVIYNWGHEEVQAHDEPENVFLKKYPKRPGEFRVMYAGNLGRMQNIEFILEVAALMKEQSNVSFYIVGSGVREEQLKSLAIQRALTNVIFVGMQPPEDVADLYKAADVNLIPLQKGLIYAAMPSKTADCLIAGKPIITCVDQEAKIVEVFKQYGISNANLLEGAKGLVKELEAVRKKHTNIDSDRLLKSRFSKEANVRRYRELIAKMREVR